MLSYTDMARNLAPQPTAPAAILATPETANEWLMSLPASIRQQVQDQLKQIAQSLPPTLQAELSQRIRAMGHEVPVPLVGVDGLGFCMVCPLLGEEVGMGQWEALAVGLTNMAASFGTQLVLKRQDASAAQRLQSNQLASDAAIAKATADANAKVQQLIVDAQLKATQMAQAGLIAQSQIKATTSATVTAPVVKSLAMWGGAAALVLALGGAVYLMTRKKA
jgi:hypothetical protein